MTNTANKGFVHQPNNRIVVLTGVSGSGKDYLTSRASEHSLIPERVHPFSFGQELFKIAQEHYPIVQTRDDLKTKLTQEEVRGEISAVVSKLIRVQPALLNTHVVYRQGESLVSNPDIEEELLASHYVYVRAEPAQISEWREQDKSRNRPAETVNQIGLHQEIALGVVAAIARHVGAEMITINNTQGHVTQNLSTIHEALNSL
jgi:adenylate kinase